MKTFEEEQNEFRRVADTFGDSAFPTTIEMEYGSRHNTRFRATSKGISKRELFSAMALQGILTNAGTKVIDANTVKDAILLADGLIAELWRTRQNQEKKA